MIINLNQFEKMSIKRLLHWGPLLAIFIMKFVSLTTMMAMGNQNKSFIKLNFIQIILLTI